MSDIKASIDRIDQTAQLLNQASLDAAELSKKLERSASSLVDDWKGASSQGFMDDLQRLVKLGQEYATTIQEAERQLRSVSQRLSSLDSWSQSPAE